MIVVRVVVRLALRGGVDTTSGCSAAAPAPLSDAGERGEEEEVEEGEEGGRVKETSTKTNRWSVKTRALKLASSLDALLLFPPASSADGRSA